MPTRRKKIGGVTFTVTHDMLEYEPNMMVQPYKAMVRDADMPISL